MDVLTFELARLEHAEAIAQMRDEAAADLNDKLGEGRWGGNAHIQSIRRRIEEGDPINLRYGTLYVACRNGNVVGSLALDTWPPNFWKKKFWREPDSKGLGVTGVVVFPEMQRNGIGQFLMEGVENIARHHDIPFVRLDAYSSNPFSNSFYRSLGYEMRIEINLRGLGLNLYEKEVRC